MIRDELLLIRERLEVIETILDELKAGPRGGSAMDQQWLAEQLRESRDHLDRRLDEHRRETSAEIAALRESTQRELLAFREEVRSDFRELGQGTQNEFLSFRAEVRSEFRELRESTAAGFAGVNAQFAGVNAQFAAVHEWIDRQQWRFVAALGSTAVAILTPVLLLLIPMSQQLGRLDNRLSRLERSIEVSAAGLGGRDGSRERDTGALTDRLAPERGMGASGAGMDDPGTRLEDTAPTSGKLPNPPAEPPSGTTAGSGRP